MTDKKPEAPQRPAWKEPLVWLVVGLPASVVVAGIVTVFIAARGADPVLQVAPPARQELTPAMKARNAAATEAARAAAAEADARNK